MKKFTLILLSLILCVTSYGIGPVTGTLSLCSGSNTTLSDTASGGSWSSSNILVATIVTGSGFLTRVSTNTVMVVYLSGFRNSGNGDRYSEPNAGGYYRRRYNMPRLYGHGTQRCNNRRLLERGQETYRGYHWLGYRGIYRDILRDNDYNIHVTNRLLLNGNGYCFRR